MLENAKTISAPAIIKGCPEFVRRFRVTKKLRSAVMTITALGVYAAYINGRRVGDFALAPGWTVYRKRVQVQTYDITDLLRQGRNELTVDAAGGWYSGVIARSSAPRDKRPVIIAEVRMEFDDDSSQTFITDPLWRVRESRTTFADIYNGEHYDATLDNRIERLVEVRKLDRPALIKQQGEKIVTMEEFSVAELILTPKGEKVLDFGQEITGYVRFKVNGRRGQKIRLTCAEMLDRDGNFYNENYRSAKSEMVYTCKDGVQEWNPTLTFYGFRYIRVEGIDNVVPEDFRAVVLCSDIKRTGRLKCALPEVNRLFENVVWGQKGNFLDIPTDCPQRDERQGWTGDAQVFVNTACYQFDVKRFFTKWLNDMRLEQRPNGAIPDAIPDAWGNPDDQNIRSSAAWGDAAVVCPWTLYQHYGDPDLLRSHYEMMRGWVSYISRVTTTPFLWTGYKNGGGHFGDWLGLDAPEGSYTGATDKDFIASAYYYHAVDILLQAAQALGKNSDIKWLECLKKNIWRAFNVRYPDTKGYRTMTEYALAMTFGLTPETEYSDDAWLLAKAINENGGCLQTGFVGTPYLLYALSRNGQLETAYSLLLQTKFPSWLYEVEQGATTIWEHWDGRKPDGSFWSPEMNSFNHYAYGAVAGWVFEEAAGIRPYEPGFKVVRLEPKPDPRLGELEAELMTPNGIVRSSWHYEGDKPVFFFETDMPAYVTLWGRGRMVNPGKMIFTR